MGRATVYNELYTDEVWKNVNSDNKLLLDDFIAYKRSADRSPQTIYQYFNMLRLFFCWNFLYNNNKFFVDIKKRDFVRFLGQASGTFGWSPNRIHTFKSTLSSLSNYIENILDDEYPNYRNLIQGIEVAMIQPVREKTVLTQKQIDKGLRKLVRQEKYQLACYLALAIASGARKAELLRFKVSYFDDANIKYGCLYRTPEPIRTKGPGKKGKMLYKYTFVKMFKPYFDLWMKYRKEHGIESEWLFIAKHGGVYTQATVGAADNWCEAIGDVLGAPFYSHAARHRYVTMLKEQKLPDSVIVEIMGWSSSDMVKIYSDMDESEILADYFDENGIKKDIKVGRLTDIK